MKNVISRVLTLVIVASTISNTTNCYIGMNRSLLQQKKLNIDVSAAKKHAQKVDNAALKVAELKDKEAIGGNVPAEVMKKAEEDLDKELTQAKSFLQRVKETGTMTKVLVAAVATGLTLLGLDTAMYGSEGYITGPVLSAASSAGKWFGRNQNKPGEPTDEEMMKAYGYDGPLTAQNYEDFISTGNETAPSWEAVHRMRQQKGTELNKSWWGRIRNPFSSNTPTVNQPTESTNIK